MLLPFHMLKNRPHFVLPGDIAVDVTKMVTLYKERSFASQHPANRGKMYNWTNNTFVVGQDQTDVNIRTGRTVEKKGKKIVDDFHWMKIRGKFVDMTKPHSDDITVYGFNLISRDEGGTWEIVTKAPDGNWLNIRSREGTYSTTCLYPTHIIDVESGEDGWFPRIPALAGVKVEKKKENGRFKQRSRLTEVWPLVALIGDEGLSGVPNLLMPEVVPSAEHSECWYLGVDKKIRDKDGSLMFTEHEARGSLPLRIVRGFRESGETDPSGQAMLKPTIWIKGRDFMANPFGDEKIRANTMNCLITGQETGIFYAYSTEGYEEVESKGIADDDASIFSNEE